MTENRGCIINNYLFKNYNIKICYKITIIYI